MRIKPIEIFLVEDNPDDVRLTREAFKDAKVRNNMNVANDGVEALAYLRREGKYAGTQIPDLIILDLNLPKKDGREVLNDIKADEKLRTIPLVVMTTSMEEKDVLAAYGLHANAYVVKPIDFSQLVAVVKSIEHFWFSVVRLPPKEK
jgi:two-component system response regulator